jgi:hypothetical protein
MHYPLSAMGRLQFRLIFLAILLALFGLHTNSVHAQDPPGDPAAIAQQQSADLTTPRATVQTFYEAMTQVEAGDDSQLEIALRCLYLNDIPEIQRPTSGRNLANRLFEVLDSITWSAETIPAEREGQRVSVTLGEDREISIVLRHNDDGAWRFSYAETLSSLDELHAQVVETAEDAEAAQEYAEGLNSPRAAVRRLLTGVNNWKSGGLDNAIQALDLSDYEKKRSRRKRARSGGAAQACT